MLALHSLSYLIPFFHVLCRRSGGAADDDLFWGGSIMPNNQVKPVTPSKPPTSESTGSMAGVSAGFRAWCSEKMIEYQGTSDLALCDFLFSLNSNTEVNEYANLYLGSQASSFAAEFIRRKLQETNSKNKKK